MDNDVIQPPIAIQVHRQNMSMTMPVSQRLAMLVFAGEFRAMDLLPLAHSAHESAMKQLGLSQCASD